MENNQKLRLVLEPLSKRDMTLDATKSFYRNVNRIANQCELWRYEAVSCGLDALRRRRKYAIQR
jgi:hypothetical protein